MRPDAVGLWPLTAQIRRVIGLSPSRVSSSAQSSTTLPGCWRRSSAIRAPRASFPRPPLGGRGGLRMTRARHLGREAQPAQPLPAGLLADGDAPAVADVGGDL